MQHYGLFINGQWVYTDSSIEVKDKFSGEVFAVVSQADKTQVDAAVMSAVAVSKQPLPPYERYKILLKTSQLISENKKELAYIIATEAGKPWKDALGEAGRAAETFRMFAEEATRIKGEMVPVEANPGSEKRFGFTIRVPLGVVCAISPFNFPLNLLSHKVAPALAAGNAVVIKPAPYTPIAAIRLCQLLQEAGLPDGWVNMINGGSDVGEMLTKDPRINFYTFTGSTVVGKKILEAVGLRRVTLEMGSNAATIVHKDANLKKAAQLCSRMAFANAGQVCISVQRVIVHKEIFDEFAQEMVINTRTLIVGDPKEMTTDVGPLISEPEAARVMDWIDEAVNQGAVLLTGGDRKGAVLQPTILTNVTKSMKVWNQEVFGPVVSLIQYEDLDEAIELVNDSEYGLQAGVFTSSLDVAFECARRIQAGGVMINDTSVYRAENMPFGGMKNSGIGREGPSNAIMDMTECKTVVFNL